MPTIIDGSLGITTPTYGGADTSEYLVPVTQFKNRIINGAMQIDQRNAGASVTPTNATYLLDRWVYNFTPTNRFSFQQNAGSVTPPEGFTNYFGATVTSSASISAGDVYVIRQRIEGFNCADLGWGTANAKTVTLSFWVRSSLTGTFGGSFQNNAENRSYPFTYTISSANTWEYKTVTVAGDTTGTWLTNNSTGMIIGFGLAMGSTNSGTAGAWANSGAISATGAVSLIGTNGATWYITGVQLEVGSTATSFDYRPYGTELMLCQRYLPAWSGTLTNNDAVGSGFFVTSSNIRFIYCYQVPTRVSPTGVVVTNASGFSAFNGLSNPSGSSITFASGGNFSAALTLNTGASTSVGTGAYVYQSGANASFYLTGCEL